MPQPLRPTLREAFDAAIVAQRAQGLELSSFGLEIGERVVREELTPSEAVGCLLKHYQEFNQASATAH
jgi:hypothetical protein